MTLDSSSCRAQLTCLPATSGQGHQLNCSCFPTTAFKHLDSYSIRSSLCFLLHRGSGCFLWSPICSSRWLDLKCFKYQTFLLEDETTSPHVIDAFICFSFSLRHSLQTWRPFSVRFPCTCDLRPAREVRSETFNLLVLKKFMFLKTFHILGIWIRDDQPRSQWLLTSSVMLLYSLTPKKFCLNPAAEIPRNRFPSSDQTTGRIPRKQGSRIGSIKSWVLEGRVHASRQWGAGSSFFSFFLSFFKLLNYERHKVALPTQSWVKNFSSSRCLSSQERQLLLLILSS